MSATKVFRNLKKFPFLLYVYEAIIKLVLKKTTFFESKISVQKIAKNVFKVNVTGDAVKTYNLLKNVNLTVYHLKTTIF